MKRLLAVAILILFAAVGAKAQTGTITFSIKAPASLGNVTATQNSFYQNQAATTVLSSSTNGFNSSCTATWQAGTATAVNLPVAYSGSAQTLTASISASMTNAAPGTTVTVDISCTPTPLTLLAPSVTLPNATAGQTYSANLATLAKPQGGIPPYNWTASGLPAGLNLSSSGVLSGVASSAGSFTFSFTVTDSAS